MRSLAAGGADLLIVTSPLIVELTVLRDSPVCGGERGDPCHQKPRPGATQGSRPRTRGWGSKGRWGALSARPQRAPRGVRGARPDAGPPLLGLHPPWERGGLCGGSSPERSAGGSDSLRRLHQQTDPGVSPLTHLRACFDFYLKFHGGTPGPVPAMLTDDVSSISASA